jgi:hypothetical protein
MEIGDYAPYWQVAEYMYLPGVDVMITIFCDFCQFTEKKLAFFSKTNVMIKFIHN